MPLPEQASLQKPTIHRYHKKKDGILMIDQNGRTRFLSFFESLNYRFWSLFRKG